MVTLLIAARRRGDGMTAVLLSSGAVLQPGARKSLAVESYLGFFCSASLFILRSSNTFFNDNFQLESDGREIERGRYINFCTRLGLLWDVAQGTNYK